MVRNYYEYDNNSMDDFNAKSDNVQSESEDNNIEIGEMINNKVAFSEAEREDQIEEKSSKDNNIEMEEMVNNKVASSEAARSGISCRAPKVYRSKMAMEYSEG